MLYNDTIAAIATGMTSSGIGIIRISGSDAFAVAEKIFRPHKKDKRLSEQETYTIHYGTIMDGKETLLFRANTAFLGAKIPSGEHKIVLVYHAPGRTAGSWCSLMGGMLALILVICEKKKQQNGSERAGESKMLQKQRKYYIIRV